MNPTQNQEVIDLLNENHRLKLEAKGSTEDKALVNAVLLTVAERHMTCTTNLDHDPEAAHAYDTVRALFVAHQQRVDEEFRGQLEKHEEEPTWAFFEALDGSWELQVCGDWNAEQKRACGDCWSDQEAIAFIRSKLKPESCALFNQLLVAAKIFGESPYDSGTEAWALYERLKSGEHRIQDIVLPRKGV